jgi:heterodisulfide reductase subunit C
MRTVNLSGVKPEADDLAKQIAAKAGVNLTDCYQCGKCSAGCPMADEMDMPPQQIMRMLQMGLVDKALHARAPWICAGCMVCSARCPQEIEISDVMREVRRASHAKGYAVVKESEAFETLFIDKIRKGGRNNEQYLAAGYNFKSGHLTQDLGSAAGMFSRGLVGIKAHHVADKAAVRRLVDRCLDKSKGGE